MRSAAVKTLWLPCKPAVAGLGIILASTAFAPEAFALPGIDRAPAAAAGQSLQQARWVCGPYRCWRQPGYGWGPGYGYGGWGSGYGYGGWGRGYDDGGWGGQGYGWGGGRRGYW